MPIDVTQAGSPGWWLHRLLGQLADRQPRLNWLDSYYKGDPDLPEGAQQCRDAYRQFQRKSRTNFSSLVVEAVRERMIPTGFRTGADGDELGDDEAWRIWQANALDADSSIVHRSMLSMGDAYVIVGGVDPTIDAPLITPEDPRQVITVHDPSNRRRVRVAAKAYTDDDMGLDVAYLYLPGEVWRAERAKSGVGTMAWDASWEWSSDVPEPLPSNVVPVVRFPNRADTFGCSMGEFEDVKDILDRINHSLLQRLVIITTQAFRQRVIKGNLPTHDAQGNEMDYNGMFPSSPGALWVIDSDVDMWESGQADITGILSGIRHDVQDLAAVTRTPLFYLTPDSANGSAEGASLAREGLVFKTGDRIVQASESWEQVMSLAFLFAGDETRARRPDMETIWAPPERFSLAERYDAASKAQAAGVPWRTVMTDVLQFSPQQVDRMEAERSTDVFLTALAQPEAVPTELAT